MDKNLDTRVSKSEKSLDAQLIELLKSHDINVDDLRVLIARGADPNAIYTSDIYPNYSVLMLAAKHSNLELSRALLEAGADPNYSNRNGYTALFMASSGKHMELLVRFGATYPLPTSFNETPMKSAYRDCNFEKVRFLRSIGAPWSDLRLSALHLAIVNGQPLTIDTVVDRYDAIDESDFWERTPLLLALQAGDVQSATSLLEMGASILAKDHLGETGLHLAVSSGSLEAVKLVLDGGLDIGAMSDFGHSSFRSAAESEFATRDFGTNSSIIEYLVERLSKSSNYFQELDAALSACESPVIGRWLVSLGANLNEAYGDIRENLNPSAAVDLSLQDITQDQFLRAHQPRFGSQNPEICNELFWQAMIVTRESAYGGKLAIQADTDEWYQKIAALGPAWSADRFGQSITWLDDGRCIEIAGEHEDSYDPDFYIYNDVFVHEPGKLPQIYLYPREVFPPTDFHSATLIGDWIYIIGSLGYPEDRANNVCPVYRLNINTFCIEPVSTTGKDPGRMCMHRAILREKRYIEISDGKLCALDIEFETPSPPAVFDAKNHVWLEPESRES